MIRRFLRLILKNGWYKFTAIILSIFLWYLVQGEEVLEVDKKLRVSMQVPEGLIIKGDAVRYKDATVRGSRVLINEITGRALEGRIKVGREGRGLQRYRVGKELFAGLDPRLKLTIHEPYIDITVDEKVDRVVPVKEFITGTPADGFIIQKTSIKPKKVTVTGLRSEVSRVQRIMTEPIDIGGLKESKTFEVFLAPEIIDRGGLSQEKVSVTFEMGEDKINKTFANIPLEVIGSDFITQVRPQYISIEVQGTAGVLDFVRREDLRAFVEVFDAGPGRYEKGIQVQIPARTVLIETRPKTAAITIQKLKRQNH